VRSPDDRRSFGIEKTIFILVSLAMTPFTRDPTRGEYSASHLAVIALVIFVVNGSTLRATSTPRQQ
jgi:hypothetical protein